MAAPEDISKREEEGAQHSRMAALSFQMFWPRAMAGMGMSKRAGLVKMST